MVQADKPPIVVTGSAGFIGFHFARFLLRSGHRVVGIDNLQPCAWQKLKEDRLAELTSLGPAFTFFKQDIRDDVRMWEILDDCQAEAICHFAALTNVRDSMRDPLGYYETNVKGFLVILEAARKFAKTKVIFASSSSVYGTRNIPPYSVDMPTSHPLSVYAASKIADEMLAYTYAHNYGMVCVGLRMFNVYGPWNRPDTLLFSFLDALLTRQPLVLYNHGRTRRAFTYIDDILPAILKAMDFDGYAIFNLGNNLSVSIGEILEQTEKNLGISAMIDNRAAKLEEVLDTSADIGKSQKYLDFDPKTSIEHGIARSIEWYLQYFQGVK